MNPAEASARAVDELTDVALPHLPMTDVDRVEDSILADCAEAERTIQRLIAQQDASAKTIEALGAENASLRAENQRLRVGLLGRCDSIRGSLRCVGTQGHRSPHWAALAGDRAMRWGMSGIGCFDPDCTKTPGHDRPHNDGQGRSWWPDDEDDS